MAEKRVANPGSTLGEAIGKLVELEVNRLLLPIAKENGCVYKTAGPINPRTGRPTKLLLSDAVGNYFQIDSVIANARLQPLILIESKYIRYTKHNRDKGSWVCTAHYSLRRQYPTVRKSIAVIAGNWSGPSKALMESFDISLFEVGFSKVADTLAEYGVDILWEEKERERVELAWKNWTQLSETQFQEISHKLLTDIEPDLRESIKLSLDTTVPRKVSDVEISVQTNLGESRYYNFNSIKKATEFLKDFNEQEVLNDENGPAMRATSLTTTTTPTSLWSTVDTTDDTGEEA